MAGVFRGQLGLIVDRLLHFDGVYLAVQLRVQRLYHGSMELRRDYPKLFQFVLHWHHMRRLQDAELLFRNGDAEFDHV